MVVEEMAADSGGSTRRGSCTVRKVQAEGTYVEGIKEEVVLSPAHALSLIASGEEHRHVGSNNFNLFSSRSHTIFTLTVESSPSGENHEGEDVTLSQLNLIDLAGSESSKTETTGLRRKEGSYINKSLLTLGMAIFLNVVSGIKLTETAGDLAIAAAICSSFLEFPIPNNIAFIGEIGLGGELRAVPRMDKRVIALAKLGYKKCVIPKTAEKMLGAHNLDIEVLGCRTLKEVINSVFSAD